MRKKDPAGGCVFRLPTLQVGFLLVCVWPTFISPTRCESTFLLGVFFRNGYSYVAFGSSERQTFLIVDADGQTD